MQAALVADGHPDFAGFEQTDEDADEKVNILGGGVAGRRREVDAAAAKIQVQRALLLHYQRSQRLVKDGDQHAQQQPCEFHYHAFV